jgi:O-antigen/teichoic acid export membrane protein
MVIAGRRLGAEEFGIFSFALAFVSVFEPLMNFGLSQLLIREIARDKAATKTFLADGVIAKLIIAPVVFLVIYITVHFLQKSDLALETVYLMAVAALIKAVKDTFRSVLLAHELFGLDAVSLIIERLSLVIAGTFVLINGHGVIGLCWTFVLVRLTDILLIGAMVRLKVCSISCRLEPDALRNLLLAGFPIVGYAVTINVYSYVDTIMLSVLRSNEEVGWYNASYRMYEGLVIIPSIISTVFFPRLSVLYKENKLELNRLLANGLKFIFGISLVVSTVGIYFSEKVINMSFGSEYIHSVFCLQVLLAGITFAFASDFLQTALIAMDRQRLVLCAALMGLFLNVALNIWLIPYFGYVGAAAATVVAAAVVAIFLLATVFRIFRASSKPAYVRSVIAKAKEDAHHCLEKRARG